MTSHSSVWLLVLLAVIVSLESAAAQKPNVVVILTDDQGWGDLSLNGNTNLSTPSIDSLARDGASFDRFFVCPVCSPTRCEFLTGRYHPRAHVYSTSAGGERMDTDVATVADYFRGAGYATAAFGKWHNGMQYPYHPNARGFEEFYGFCSGHWGNYFDPILERNGAIVRGRGFIIDDLTEQAMRFIERHREAPFFVYLPLNTPHSPMQVPERWWRKFKEHPLPMRHRDNNENLPHARAALAMCENIDWNVGRLLAKLEALRLSENTIVVYFCDNGPNGARWNGGMKGRKGSTDEGGVRSPLLVRWPGRIPQGHVVPQIAGAIDLLPTLCGLAQVEAPGDGLDGVSLAPLLQAKSEDVEWADRLLFSTWRDRVSVRTQQFRLDHQGQLFDMVSDPEQRIDASQEFPEVAMELQRHAAKFRGDLLPSRPAIPRPFVVGHPDAKYTQIPARDGQAHGNIQRSNRFPNCSYFTNWRDTRDKVTWDIEVPASGVFDVDLYYTCAQADVGSTVAISFLGETLASTIDAAHDPPVVGAEHDRLPRQESYVKDFRPLHMGRLSLQEGKGSLVLQATDIPGRFAMDFRLIMLTRVE